MLTGPSRQLRAYLLMERVMMEADGEDDAFGTEIAESEGSPLEWTWARLSDDEKAWLQARTQEQIEASLAMPIGTPGFYELTPLRSLDALLAQHKIEPAQVQEEVAKLLRREPPPSTDGQ